MNTRRFKRSMADAFGPYTDNRLHPMPDERSPLDAPTLAIAAIAVLALALAVVGVLG